jgi:hypothetical protein
LWQLVSLLDYVSVCTASPVMHTRVLAAKALVPLVEPQQAPKFIATIEIGPQQSNHLHGKLLQVVFFPLKYLINILNNFIYLYLQLAKLARDVALSDEICFAYEEKFKQGLYLLSPEHCCPVTKGAYIDVLLEICTRTNRLEDTSKSVLSLLPTVFHCKGKVIIFSYFLN